MEIDILNNEGKVDGKAKIPEHLLGDSKKAPKANRYLLHEVIRAYLANQRKGTHSTLTRTEVSKTNAIWAWCS